MAAVYTVRLVGTRIPAGSGPITLFHHDRPEVLILRDIVLTNTSGSSGFLDLYVRTPTGNVFLWRERQFAAESTRHFDIRQELLRGEFIELYREALDVSVLITAYSFPP